MKKLNTYKVDYLKAIATIENKGQYWRLTIQCKEPKTLFHVPNEIGQGIHNTLKSAKIKATELINKYRLN